VRNDSHCIHRWTVDRPNARADAGASAREKRLLNRGFGFRHELLFPLLRLTEVLFYPGVKRHYVRQRHCTVRTTGRRQVLTRVPTLEYRHETKAKPFARRTVRYRELQKFVFSHFPFIHLPKL
jgi:hypothetical protein